MKNIDPLEYRKIQESIPICCVDILPINLSEKSIGLILRDTPHQGLRWCLIGGRLGKNESIVDAISRELHDALGNDVHFSLNDSIQPTYVAEYFPIVKENAAFDPRQHAIGLTFCIPIYGSFYPQNEAHKFNWFKISEIPKKDEFGFDQDLVVKACLYNLKIERKCRVGKGDFHPQTSHRTVLEPLDSYGSSKERDKGRKPYSQ